MENIIKALDTIIEDVTGGADAETILAELEELKGLVGEQGEAEEKPKDDPIRKAMGLKPKE